MPSKPIVLISSTALDLPEYRTQVMDACLRGDVVPKMMEHLPALAADAIHASLRLVDEADVYVGIFAHRYGYVPDGHNVSITEMEYERALERGIPRLIFMMSDEVPVLPKDYDRGESAEKLEALKERLMQEQVVASFKSPEDLRGHVLQSLAEVQKQLNANSIDDFGRPCGTALATSLHHVTDIPTPPEPYIAHPYTLLQVRRLVGRKEELETLTDWITGKRYAEVRIFNVVAIGGMGKSALTWTWFDEIAPQEMAPLAGRIWWSFYESDATFENFVTRVLAYVSRRPLEEINKLTPAEREDSLIHILNRESYLIVLDGLERVLTAYARLDAAYIRDEESLDEETANRVAGALGLPPSASQSFVGKHRLRMAAAPRVGRFLRELARLRLSRILVSTRLYPADLQAPGGRPSPGCEALFLPGLSDQDAIDLWREFGARGSREKMLPVFESFGKHPLLIQLLAFEVADFRNAPGDFDEWSKEHPDFNPFGMPLVQVQSHVLEHAIRGLSKTELRALHVIAAFRMPASMAALRALLLRTDEHHNPTERPFASVRELDAALVTLEDRGLLGWDRRANRYDLHPIVRGVIWSSLDENMRLMVLSNIRNHFETMEMVSDLSKLENLDDLSPAIELYHTLVGLNLYDEAYSVFRNRLERAIHYRFGVGHLQVQLLEHLFPDGTRAIPRLSQVSHQGVALNALALAYDSSGRPGDAVSVYRLAYTVAELREHSSNTIVTLTNLSDGLRLIGHLYSAEAIARLAISLSRRRTDRGNEADGLLQLGLALSMRGELDKAVISLKRASRIWNAAGVPQLEGVAASFLAQLAIWGNDVSSAEVLANLAWELADVERFARDHISAARLQGVTALHVGDLPVAGERLHNALARVRSVSLVDEELRTLVAMAEYHSRRGEATQARSTLDEVWGPAQRGPYPLFHSDALNVLAQVEKDAGNTDAAVQAATLPYSLAWCDGPPFAYHWGLEKARAHLAALGVPEPGMPPFNESEHEHVPHIEINPPDEFGSADKAE